jgi:putative tricarboxylic transport membrane protein
VLNLPLVGLWVRLLTIPQHLLYGGILVFSTLGVYSLNRSVTDLVLLLLFGLVGWVMRRFDIPVAPCIIGLILGPMAEEQLRRALSISQGNLVAALSRPLTLTILVLAVLVVLIPALLARRRAGQLAGTLQAP